MITPFKKDVTQHQQTLHIPTTLNEGVGFSHFVSLLLTNFVGFIKRVVHSLYVFVQLWAFLLYYDSQMNQTKLVDVLGSVCLTTALLSSYHLLNVLKLKVGELVQFWHYFLVITTLLPSWIEELQRNLFIHYN